MSDIRKMWAICVDNGYEGLSAPLAVCWSLEKAERVKELIARNPSASGMKIFEVEIIEP